MTKRYSILQRKLQELEFELSQVFSLPATTQCSQPLLEDIRQRFVFVNNLLSAEVASHPSKPHHLHHIQQRLTELERNFRACESFKTHVDDDNASRCSCTESCLNDDGKASADSGSPVYEEGPKKFSLGFVEEKARVEFSGGILNQENVLQAGYFNCLVEEKAKQETKGEEERRVGVRSLCGAMAIGAVLGMALMCSVMVRFSGCFQYYAEPRSFLIST
jgi:hypothetical protein